MRCDNCGWMNPEGVENCQKCNQKLRPSHFEEHKVVNVPRQEPAPAPAVVNCDKCGREYSLQMPSCPHCGFSNPKFQEDSAPAPKANDMNKTVAFGVGMASSQQSVQSESSFGVQDKSELKKTMIAGRENSASPAAMPPFNVQDKSELKKTMAAGDFESFQMPVAKVAGAPNMQNTVCDMAVDGCESYKYSLQSMDHGAQDTVSLTISASTDICLKSGEVILIAGMRYRVI